MVTPVVPQAFVVCAVSALYFAAVDALCGRLLFRGCFDLGVIYGLHYMYSFSTPPPNPAVKWDVALKRAAPYF